MDDIKLPRGFGQVNQPQADNIADAKPSRNFSVLTGSENGAPLPAASSLGATSRFSKLDLQDPAKLDGIVHSSVTEIVDGQTSSLPISNADKQALVDFLSHDPLFRQRVESYLRKALP